MMKELHRSNLEKGLWLWRKILCSYFCIAFFVLFSGSLTQADQRPGVDCGCDLTKNYLIPEKGKSLYRKIITATEGSSQSGKYTYTAGGSGVFVLRVYNSDSAQILYISFIPSANVYWGFSPDEDRFVIHFITNVGTHKVMLYDLTTNPANKIKEYNYITGTSKVQFSAKGRYFLYAAKLGGARLGETLIGITDVTTGSSYQDFVVPYVDIDDIGLAAWGFSPLSKYAATVPAFFYGWKTSQEDVTWRLVNLGNLSMIQEGGTGSGTFWGFSPCGDVAGLIEEGQTGNGSEASIFSTDDGSLLGDGGLPESNVTLFAGYPGDHILKYDDSTFVPLAENTAGNPCTGSSDTNPPSWTGASLTAMPTDTTVNLNWEGAADDDTGVTNYRIYQDGVMLTTLPDISSFLVEDLSPETEYSFKVEAGDAAGNWSADGPAVTVTTEAEDPGSTDTTPPTWPVDKSLLVSNVTETSAMLSWSAAEDDTMVTKYQIYYANYTLQSSTDSALRTLVLDGLAPGVYYYFQVQACDGAGNCSSDGPSQYIITPDLTPPSWPEGAVISVDDRQTTNLTISWPQATDNAGVMSYRLYLDPGPSQQILATLESNVTTYHFSCLQPGTSYRFGIEAGDPADNWSVMLRITATTQSSANQCSIKTERASVDSSGNQVHPMEPPGMTGNPSISADGRYVVFASDAIDLVANDNKSTVDIFVHDRETGETSLVSLSSDGTASNDWSLFPDINANGRYVIFSSFSDNLVNDDNNFAQDVFLRDLEAQTTEIVSLTYDGGSANASSGINGATISADGRYVAFGSQATNLIDAVDENVYVDIFVHDRQTGTNTLVSKSSSGTQADYVSGEPSISDDGRFIAFVSHAGNLVSDDTNTIEICIGLQCLTSSAPDIFVHDLVNGTTERVSVSTSGTEGDGSSYSPAISPDGRYVAFFSSSSNLVDDDTNNLMDVFLHDRQTGTTERVNLSSSGEQTIGITYVNYRPAISAGGRYVVFSTTASNLVEDDTNGAEDVFIRDRFLGLTEMISVCACGDQGNDRSIAPAISADGRTIAFEGWANNLLKDFADTNDAPDVFVHHREPEDTDGDGICDTEEDAGDDSTYGYDGNADGIADHDQATVVSMFTAQGSDFTTLGMVDPFVGSFANVMAKPDPFAGEEVAGVTYPYGLFSFDINFEDSNINAEVAFLLPQPLTVNSCDKYGPTLENADNHWYEFLYDLTTGCVINETDFVVFYEDGLRGDSDLTVDGIISETGIAPSFNSALDRDGDGVLDGDDNCPDDENPNQEDLDGDGLGNICDPDDDDDGVNDSSDNCPNSSNAGQADSDGDGAGDSCDVCPGYADSLDADGDGIADCIDGSDSDGDGYTDAEEVLCGSAPANINSRCSVGLPFLMLLLGD